MARVVVARACPREHRAARPIGCRADKRNGGSVESTGGELQQNRRREDREPRRGDLRILSERLLRRGNHRLDPSCQRVAVRQKQKNPPFVCVTITAAAAVRLMFFLRRGSSRRSFCCFARLDPSHWALFFHLLGRLLHHYTRLSVFFSESSVC